MVPKIQLWQQSWRIFQRRWQESESFFNRVIPFSLCVKIIGIAWPLCRIGGRLLPTKPRPYVNRTSNFSRNWSRKSDIIWNMMRLKVFNWKGKRKTIDFG